jgi:hypothetical protein
MDINWVKNLSDPKLQEDFKRTVLSARPVLDRLKELIEEKEATLDRAELSVTAYDVPNWDAKQAHMNGIRAAYKGIYTLITLDHKERK